MTKALTRDVLTSVLRTLRLRVRLLSRGDYCGQWALDSGEHNKATFHLVGRGSLWMHCASRDEPLLLSEDDLLVFHRPQWHQFSCSRRKSATAMPGDRPRKEQVLTTVICCVVEFESGAHNLVLRSLPAMSVVSCREQQASSELVALARHMLSEHDAETPGFEAVMERLAEALFIEVLRHHMRQGHERGLLRALADPQLGRALSALHAQPGRDWNVVTLAGMASMSRSHFARRFSECLETTPMHYLAEWRMQLADELLRDPRQSVARVAETLGFQTEGAFRRAFKRLRKVGPGTVRRAARS